MGRFLTKSAVSSLSFCGLEHRPCPLWFSETAMQVYVARTVLELPLQNRLVRQVTPPCQVCFSYVTSMSYESQMFTEGFLNYFSKQLIYFSICFCKIYKKKSYLQNNIFPTHILQWTVIIQLLEVDVSRMKHFLKEIFSAICHISNGFNDKIFKKTEKKLARWLSG